MPQVFGAGEKDPKAHLRLFSSFFALLVPEESGHSPNVLSTFAQREGSRFRVWVWPFQEQPLCAAADLSAQSCAPAQLCRLLWRKRSFLCFLQGANPAVSTWLGCCDRWHSALLGLCHQPWCWCHHPRAVVGVGHPGDTPVAAQPSLGLPSARELLPCSRAGIAGASMPCQGVIPCSEGCGGPCLSPSRAGAWPGHPGLSLNLTNHRESTWLGGLAGKMNYFGFLPALFSQPRCNVAVLCQGAFSPLHSCRIWCREYFELWLWLSQSCTSRARGTKDFSSFA